MRYVNQTVTGFPIGPFVDPSDGVSPVSNLVASSLNGISIVNNVSVTYIPTSLVYLANGFYAAAVPSSFPLGPMEISFSNPSVFAPVWNELSVISQNVYNSFFGSQSLTPSASGSGSDPWAVALPGSYSAGQAGNIVGNKLDATVSSRSTFAGGAVASVTAPVTITQSFPTNFSSLGINASGYINRVILTNTTTSVTNPVVLPTIAPSGYGCSGSDPWLTDLPGSYTGSQAGYVLGAQASIPIVGTVHAGASSTNFILSITSGNSPTTSEAIDGRGCLFKSGNLIGAYPTIIASDVTSPTIVAITVSGMPTSPALNDVAWII